MIRTKKVLVFGIFDGVHPGHIDFLRQAKNHGDFLVVAVGRPEAVKKFKNKLPKYSLAERLKFVRKIKYANKAISGDKEQGSYKIILVERPDIICFGYDQKVLNESLKKWVAQRGLKIKLKILKSYKPKIYHTSIVEGK